MRNLPPFLSRWLTGVTILGMLIAMAGIQPALAQEAEQPTAGQEAQEPKAAEQPPKPTDEAKRVAEETPVDVGFAEELVVTGFRQSLEQSVELKRDAVNTRDSIVAEEIGKMPDLNVAEAIQRVPGVAIVREGGEGRNISLRGLDADFTRVTLNGMEVPASAGGLDSSGGVNRDRAFDFNVFSAEIFNRIDIEKSAIASVEEGGVAGTVEMYTARPLDNPGLRASATLLGGYNDLSEKSDPRVTAIVGTTNKASTMGVLVSAAYTGRTVYQDGFGTVRWAQPDKNFKANETTLSNAELNSLWYPRLPRQDSFHHDQERLGLSGAFQYRPNDKLDFGLNWVYSKFDATTDSYNSFAQFRRSGSWGYHTITPTDVTVATDGDSEYAIAGSFKNVALRTESRQTVDTTDFNQVTADFGYDLNDKVKLTGMIGQAASDYVSNYFRTNIETLTGTTFSYDFRQNPDVAAIHYGLDVTDPNNYVLQDNELFNKFGVDRTNQTARIDLEWFPVVRHSVKFGAIYNDREVDSRQSVQNVAPPADLAAISRVYTYADTGGYGSGTQLAFLVLDFAKAKEAYGFGTFSLERGPGRQTWTVIEKTLGTYVDYDLNTELSGHFLRLNLGARYVTTDTEATGWLSSTIKNTETNSYGNLLPSLNIAFDATKNIVLRAAVSRTMTRASLSSLAPSKTYTDVNFTVSGGNSQLKPLKSDNVDLGLEWYFAKDSVVGVALFYKDIKSFIASPTTQEPLRPEDRAAVALVYPTQPELLDPSLIWTYSTSANVDGTNLKGFELAYQQPFKGLPGFWKNFGFAGNYSYVDAETQVARGGETVKVPLEGMSKHSWNATLYYEVNKGGVRVSVNKRDDYITTNIGANGNVSEATTGPVRWDMSAFLNLTGSFSLTLEAINLTDEPERLYTTGDGTMNLVREYNYTGRQIFAGVRVDL